MQRNKEIMLVVEMEKIPTLLQFVRQHGVQRLALKMQTGEFPSIK